MINENCVFYVTSISVPTHPDDRDGNVTVEIQFNESNTKAQQISNEGVNYLMDYLNKLGEIDADQ